MAHEDIFEYFDFVSEYLDVYLAAHGGKWFYVQNAPGSEWFDHVSNDRGWTVDFNLEVMSVQNSLVRSNEIEPDGLGIYVNDGTHYETIYFLEQEIIFAQADQVVTFDTTQATNYRLTGKHTNLNLYARREHSADWNLIKTVPFEADASNTANSRKPSVVEDVNGVLHAVWYDDGNGLGQIYYSTLSDSENAEWTTPEVVVSSNYAAINPSVSVDFWSNPYVVYEISETGLTNIAFTWRNANSWSVTEFIDPHASYSLNPVIRLDSEERAHVVWEDYRLGQPEIFYSHRDPDSLRWSNVYQVSESIAGSYHPAITSYFEDIFVTWTENKDPVYEGYGSDIRMSSRQAGDGEWLPIEDVSGVNGHRADYSDILVTIKGQVVVVWHDHRTGGFEIWKKSFMPNLEPMDNVKQITDAEKALYPKIAEQKSTSDLVIVWEDHRDLPDDSEVDQACPRIFAAVYDSSKDSWTSSNLGQHDVRIQASDERVSFRPNVPSLFTQNLHILYETEFATAVDEYQPIYDKFSDIRDVVYNLNKDEVFDLTDPDYDRDLIITESALTKEIRFGDFSEFLSTKSRYKQICYYTHDAVSPLQIMDISNNIFETPQLHVNNSLVNDHGDSWIASTCGLWFYHANTQILAEITDENIKDNNVTSVTVDGNGNLFVSVDSTVYYSLDHESFSELSISDVTVNTITDLKASQSQLAIGAENGMVLVELQGDRSSDSLSVNMSEQILSDSHVTSVTFDRYSWWAGTREGLYRYINGTTVYFSTNNGLSSNRVNDIAVRSSGVRYIATSNGVDRMSGSDFEPLDRDLFYNQNVKSVTWQEPNILWAGSLSYLNQLVENEDKSFTTAQYSPEDYSTEKIALDDHKTFFIVTDTGEDLPEDAYVEVYLNGNRITQGYEISLENTDNPIIRFHTDLLPSDSVDVVIRDDIRLLTSFYQDEIERQKIGRNTVQIQDVQATSNGIYISTSGDTNEVRANEESTPVPYDRIHLDTEAPYGCLSITNRINANTVEVSIDDATDGDNGSGIEKMILSNFQNFTSDGSTPLDPVPFTTSATHSFGSSISQETSSLEFDNGTGNIIRYFEEEAEAYAGTAKPAAVYKIDLSTGQWTKILSFSGDRYVDLIERFNNKFLIGLGHDTQSAKLYIYEDNGRFSSPTVSNLSGNRIYSAKSLANTLYIGTGDNGYIYGFNGNDVSVAFENIGSNVYGLAIAQGALFAATGEGGHIYRINVSEESSIIAHQDGVPQIRSIESFSVNDKNYLFAGTGSEGKILRSLESKDEFNISFTTVDSKSNALKVLNDRIYAVLDDAVYSLGSDGTWAWEYTHTENIWDITYFQDALWVISNSKVALVSQEEQERKVYLKLIDKAGNETALKNENGDIVDCYTASVSIEDVRDFVNKNQLIEVDKQGTEIYNLRGSDNFYSADKIEEEKAVYDSEIFDGTNDIVKWSKMSWLSNEPTDTEVLMYVRAASSRTNIMTKEFIGPYTRSDSSGVDLSFLTGQFIQFRAVLKSKNKGVSPSLNRVLIENQTSEATHFFTTNFVLPSDVSRMLLTSEKMIPISADVVFGINTTDSVSWSDYQIIDENRLTDVVDPNENFRVGIRLISPARSDLLESTFDEYGPYNSELFVNTIDYLFTNNNSNITSYDFRVIFYEDINLTQEIMNVSSADDPDSFSTDGEDFPSGGKVLDPGDEVQILFAPPGSANIQCDTFYFVKVIAINRTDNTEETIIDDRAFISGCNASFINTIDFDFTNGTGSTSDFHFRIRFYKDEERTNLALTRFSSNDRSGWSVDNEDIDEEGVSVEDGETVSVAFTPDITESDIEADTIYHLTIDAYDGSEFILASNSYTFQATDPSLLIYCGEYMDVPVVKNFGLMFELANNELVTLNK